MCDYIAIILFIGIFVGILPCLFYPLARFSRHLRKFYCKIGWHSYTHLYETVVDDVGWTKYAKNRCPWCGYEGLVDSQGNLF